MLFVTRIVNSLVLSGLLSLSLSSALYAQGIHDGPIVLKGKELLSITNYPIEMYRFFRIDADGRMKPIPFQIDEVNGYGDFVLEYGPLANPKDSNGIFDSQDELSLMGNDVGPVGTPQIWPGFPPDIIEEIRFDLAAKDGDKAKQGAIYAAIYFQNPPRLDATTSYVAYSPSKGEVQTSRYRYRFDLKNYLVAQGVDIVNPAPALDRFKSLIDSSSFHLFADLKYFVSVNFNHRDVDSQLEAYRSGPIRTIVRFNFFYNILKLQFKLGLYTELSFFSNAVYLPAILYNPLDGQKVLDSGSGFYYGFALKDNPSKMQIETNMPSYSSGFVDKVKRTLNKAEQYWLTAMNQTYMIFLKVRPSPMMLADDNIPRFYLRDISGPELVKNGKEKIGELGNSPVNIALFFDLSKFRMGEHFMSLQLFIENTVSPTRLKSFQQLSEWVTSLKRIELKENSK